MLKKSLYTISESITCEVVYKKVKKLNLRVSLTGKVVLTCPKLTPQFVISKFLEEKTDWISQNLEKFQTLNNKYNPKFETGEKHLLFGKEYQLKIQNVRSKKPSIFIYQDSKIIFNINEKISLKTKEKHLNGFYAQELEKYTRKIFEKYESLLGVEKEKLIIKKMKGKWGYCIKSKKVIGLNTELAKKESNFIEYVVLHELCHLIENNHGPKFKNLLYKYMPEWKKISKC